MDMNEKDFTYANLQILHIKRMLDNMLNVQDYSDAELVNIGLEILRILCDISSGVIHFSDDDEREWDLFYDAQKSEKGFLFFIHDLYIKCHVKNELINDLLERNGTEELMKLIKQNKGE